MLRLHGPAHLHHAYDVFLANGRDSRALTVATVSCRSSALNSSLLSKTQLNESFFPHSLPVRLHDPLWMVRRVPLPPNRSVVASSSVVSLCPSLTDRLNQGSLLPPLVSHIFCNAMGLPQPLSAIDRHPSKALDILAVYVLGIIGFTLAMVKGW
jgi:hypothetical protein